MNFSSERPAATVTWHRPKTSPLIGVEAVNRTDGDRDAMSVKNNSVRTPGCAGGPAGGIIETRQGAFLIADLARDIPVWSGRTLARQATSN